MMKRTLVAVLCVIVMLVGLTIPAAAQDEPPAWVLTALAALSSDVGQQLSIANLSRWDWEQINFPDASLGCPREGLTYAQVISPGYIVRMTYDGVEYDYRVSSNGSTVFQCSPGTSTGTVVIPPTATAPAANPSPIVTGTVVCPGALATRLSANMTATSSATVSLNIRNAPGATAADSVRGLLPPGGTVTVIGGPQCASSATWWNVTYQAANGTTTTGWAAEGDATEYWLEPVGAAGVGVDVQTLPMITTTNAAQLRVLAQVPLTNSLAELMPAPSADAFLAEGSSLPALYSGTTFQALGLTLGHTGQTVRALTLTGDPDLGAFQAATLETDPANAAQTLLYVWNVNTVNDQMQIMGSFGLTLPFAANDIEFSPDARWVAASSGTMLAVDPNTPNGVYVWEIVSGAQVATLQLPTAASGITFSPDGRFMVVSSPAANVTVFDTTIWTQITTLTGAPALSGSTALTFSPDSGLLVFGEQSGAVQVYDTATWTLLRTLTPQVEGAAAFVDFSPDGSVLAVGIVSFAGQHPQNRATTLALWDVTTGTVLTTLGDFTDTLSSVGFRSDGRQLIAIGPQTWWSWGVY